MKRYWLALMVFILITSCNEQDDLTLTCGTPATVRDLRGLDGCGFVFELQDGTLLNPYRLFYCGTGPLPPEVTQDPLSNFEFVGGKSVRIGYVEAPDVASVCMVGKMVKITCLEEVGSLGEF